MAQVRARKRGKKWSYAFEAGIVDGTGITATQVTMCT